MTPRLDQAKEFVLGAIARGDFPVGTMLPPVEELAERARCSPGTLHSALTELSREGIIQRKRRKGTVVLRTPRTRRVCLFLSLDPHMNFLLQQKVYDLLIRGGYEVEVLLNSQEVLQRKLVREAYGPQPALLSIGAVIDQEGFAEFAAQFPSRTVFTLYARPGMPEYRQVAMDPQAAARVVVEHLLRLGHRKVAVVAGWHEQERHSYASASAEACRHLLEVAGAACVPHYTFPDGNLDQLRRRFKEEGVTAFWDLSDFTAVKTLQMCREAGLRVPEDVSIVGRFDTPWCDLSTPSLTSVSIDPDASAQALVEALESSDLIRQVPPKLIARASSGPVRSQ